MDIATEEERPSTSTPDATTRDAAQQAAEQVEATRPPAPPSPTTKPKMAPAKDKRSRLGRLLGGKSKDKLLPKADEEVESSLPVEPSQSPSAPETDAPPSSEPEAGVSLGEVPGETTTDETAQCEDSPVGDAPADNDDNADHDIDEVAAVEANETKAEPVAKPRSNRPIGGVALPFMPPTAGKLFLVFPHSVPTPADCWIVCRHAVPSPRWFQSA